jgi:hypothetical protein
VRLSPSVFVELLPPERPVMGDNQPQKMRIWKGIVLMAIVGSAHKVLKNGLRYRLEEVAATARFVRIDDAGAARGEPFEMSLADVARDLRLTHALCYYSVRRAPSTGRFASRRSTADGSQCVISSSGWAERREDPT